MRWRDVVDREPKLAQLGERLLSEPGVMLVCTIKRDGAPRLSPVEPLFWREDLWLSMMFDSQKARDLMRDDRVLVHNIVTDREGRQGEYKVRGVAVPEEDEAVQASYAEVVSKTLGWTPRVGRFHLFKVDVHDVAYIRYEPSTGDQYTTRWPPGREFVRRATSATSVGPPESHREWLR
jgi:hypothetical protein